VLRHVNLAGKLLRRGANAEAQAELKKVSSQMHCGRGRLVCGEAKALIGKAIAAAGARNTQKALGHLNRAKLLNNNIQKKRKAAGFVDQESLRTLYASGMEELVSGGYEEAVIAFKKLAQYPLYMTFARMGKLRLADALYHQERYLEAVEVYNEFVALYPQDANVPYARFMAAKSLVKRMPWDNPVFSPAERLDTAKTLQAREYLESFIKAAPESPFAFDAMLLLRSVRHRIFRHHRYVAEFYQRRGSDRGELGRRLEMAFGYPEWGADRDNLNEARRLAERTESTTQANQIEKILSIRFPLSITPKKDSGVQSNPSTPSSATESPAEPNESKEETP